MPSAWLPGAFFLPLRGCYGTVVECRRGRGQTTAETDTNMNEKTAALIAEARAWDEESGSPMGSLVRRLVDALERASQPVTEERVEAGARAFYEDPSGLTSWDRLSTTDPALADKYREGIRRALEAAQEAGR